MLRRGRRSSIACVYNTTIEGRNASALAVVTIDGRQMMSIVPWYSWVEEPQWMPDGKAIAYVATKGGVSNIFAHPLDGSPEKQLTHFKSGEIGRFDWMPNGQIVMTRITSRSDAVLIHDFR